MQPRPRHVPVEAGAPPNFQRTVMENVMQDAVIPTVERALQEDLPDITSEAIFTPDERGSAVFLGKKEGILAGLDFAEATFAVVDATSKFARKARDGDRVKPGDIV